MGCVDVREFGASVSAQTTTGTTNGTTLTLAATLDFANDQGIIVYGKGSAHGLSTPMAPPLQCRSTSIPQNTIQYNVWSYSTHTGQDVYDVVVQGLRFECIVGQWARVTGEDSFNYLYCHTGQTIRRRMINCQFAGYPHGGTDSGTDGAATAKYSDNTYEDMLVEDFGGGDHENFWYFQGGTRRCATE